jgi:hypothetical protein
MKQNHNTSIETSGYGEALYKDLDVGKKVLDVLEANYAGHAWFVNAMTESGYVTIQLMYPGADEKLRIWKFGILLHCNKLGTYQDMQKKVINAGGEILERYNMARGKFTLNDYSNFISKGVDTIGMVK